MRLLSPLSLSLLAACATEIPLPGEFRDTGDTDGATAPVEDCVVTEAPLAVDEVSPAGFSGADVEAIVAGSLSAELAYADDTLTTVHVEVTRDGDPVWRSIVAEPGASCADDTLVLPLSVRVHTEDGQIDATFAAVFAGAALPTDLFVEAYVAPADLDGTLAAPTDARELGVAVHNRDDGLTHGILQWIVEPPGELATELDVGAWGTYRDE